MAERITIMLNSDIAKKLRNLQAKKVKESTSSVSFSKIINEVLEKGQIISKFISVTNPKILIYFGL